VTCRGLAGDLIEIAVFSHDVSFLPQRHSRRIVESCLVARPKRVSHDCEKYSDEDRRPERRDEIGREILDR
jgi:hypothetical protein